MQSLPQLILEYFITLKRNFTPFRSNPSFPSPPVLAITNLLSVCMDLPILDTSYKWKHTICCLLCLVFSTYHYVFKVHLCCNMSLVFYSFPWLNISFYGYTTFSLFIHYLMDIWIVSSFLDLWTMMLWKVLHKCFLWACFHFFWVYIEEWNCWVVW